MAATKAKTTAKKTAKKVEAETVKTTQKATAMLRKGTLAYVGLYGAAFDRAKFRFAQARQATDGMFDTLVARGETIETKATVIAKDAQAKAMATYATTSEKVRDALPIGANDRVEDLEAEIATLNKKINAVSKKAKPVSKETKASMKTEKTAAPVKAA